MTDIFAISLISVVVIAIIVLLIWKNKKEQKRLNPDSQIAVEEAIRDMEQRRDKI